MPLIGTRGAASAQGFGEFAQQASGVQANAIDFDGTNDTLYRSSLTGVTNGKTFTFSAWVWVDTTGSSPLFFALGGELYVVISNGVLTMWLGAVSPPGSRALTFETTSSVIPTNTFVNILYSANMASTANRRLYINDQLVTPSYIDYNDYTIRWDGSGYYVGGGTTLFDGRISNFFLDFTYRDLSVTANRRLFVTADLKPAAGQAALNPILYLPMSDPTQPGLNQGTGGNFTLTGVVARSGRGPNQYNAPYSDFDGSADYLSRTTLLTGVAVSSAFTFQCVFNTDTQTAQQYLFTVRSGTADRFYVLINTDFTNARINIEGYNSSATNLLYLSTVYGGIVPNRNYVLTVSLNLTSTATRHIYINGESVSATWSPYTNGSIDFAPSTPTYAVGGRGTTASMNGRLGALWFNTSYIDLSVPANLAKFVSGTGINAAPVDLGANGELPTGTSPLIYLPMYGNNAGKNYGTGGDFTVNSGPYTGARGPNEFWGNKAKFDGTTGYLARTSALVGVSDGKVICGSFNFTPDAAQTHQIFTIKESGGVGGLEIYVDSSGVIGFYGVLATPTAVLNASSSAGVITSIGTNYSVQYCIDLSNTAKRFVYVNGVLVTMTWSTYTNSNINLDQPRVTVGARYTSTGYGGFTNGKLAEFYFTTTYIDFSQEANQLLFRNAFGNPTDLPSAITAGTVPSPAVYMRFPPTSFGTNSGTGGDFTVNGTITDGGQL